MTAINEEFERMIAEMRRYGATPAPSKGGSYNNLLRYREAREKILDRFLAAFAEGYRLGKDDKAPTITTSGWVSVKDRLPDVGDLVVYADRIAWGYQYGIRRISRDDRVFRKERSFSFWMPLPESSKED